LIPAGFFEANQGTEMKFKAPTEHPVHIALTSGHTCAIPGINDEPAGVEIDPMFHREAIARGAEPSGVPVMTHKPGSGPTRTDVITKTLQAMLDGSDEGDFKKDGTPDLNAVSRRCGFKVQREEVDAIYKELTAS
jgi:hypothetical protein